jgi:hypothetical protein
MRRLLSTLLSERGIQIPEGVADAELWRSEYTGTWNNVGGVSHSTTLDVRNYAPGVLLCVPGRMLVFSDGAWAPYDRNKVYAA